MEPSVIIRCLKYNHRGGQEVYLLSPFGGSPTLHYQLNKIFPISDSILHGRIDQKQASKKHQVSKEEYLSIVQSLEGLTLNIFPPFQFGFDGITYCIWIQNGQSEVSFAWWLDCPLQWKSLETAFRRIVTLSLSE
jgi:hypothetical protein